MAKRITKEEVRAAWNAAKDAESNKKIWDESQLDPKNKVSAAYLRLAARYKQQKIRDQARVEYLPGDGNEYYVLVSYLGDYAKNHRSLCAFCDGDPCNENSPADSNIAQYFKNNPHAETCPMCEGRS